MTSEAERWVGPYAILGQLGEGGMARAFLARRRGSRDLVVVKMRKTVADEEINAAITQRFVREGQVNAFLRNRNVAELLDAALDADPPYLVFELVTGAPLGALAAPWLREGRPLAPGVVARILRGILAGLHHLHEARDESGERLFAVHRDLTPGNVMLNLDGVPKIIDLGLVRAEAGSYRTQLGQVLGTAQYIPPETAIGEAAWVDRTADLYSLGVVAYELLTGTYVFPPGTRVADVAEWLARPTFVPIVQRTPSVPAALAEVVERALRVEPAARWSSAFEMSKAIGAALGDDIASEAEVAAVFAQPLAHARQHRDRWQAEAEAQWSREHAVDGGDAAAEPTKTGLGVPKDSATLVVRARPTDGPSPEVALGTSELLAAARPTVLVRRGPASADTQSAAAWGTVVVTVIALVLIVRTWMWALREPEPAVVLPTPTPTVPAAPVVREASAPPPAVTATAASAAPVQVASAPRRPSRSERPTPSARPRATRAAIPEEDERLRAMEVLFAAARREAGAGDALDRYLGGARRLARQAGPAATAFERDIERLEGAAAARDEPAIADATEKLQRRIRAHLGAP